MRRLIVILISLIIFFGLNLVLFIFSDDYKFFIKKIKNPNDVVYVDQKSNNITDEIPVNKNIKKTITGTISNTENTLNKENTNTGEVFLGKKYTDILDKFSSYELGKLEVLKDDKLFDITSEYPDEYFEYYSKDLTLYLFTTKSYQNIFDIFNVLGYDLNQINGYGDKAFFINLKGEEKDSYVRMVIGFNGVAFGLKFEKNQYNKIKKILSELN